MKKRWHFHEGAVTVPDDSDILERLAHDEIVPVIAEGYWKADLQYPTPLVKKTGKSSWSQFGQAQTIGAIPTKISTLHLFADLPLQDIIHKVGYETLKDMQERLPELYRPKPDIDWFTIIFFGQVGIFGEPKTPDSHFHPEDSVTLDGNHFRLMTEGKITVAAEEGYSIFNLNKIVKINNPSDELIGFGEVIPFSTRISILPRLKPFLPIPHILKASTGSENKERLVRLFEAQYPNKRDRDWVTFSTVYVLEKIRLPKLK